LDETRIGSRIVRVDALPMGINYDLYHNVSSNCGVGEASSGLF
jgi:trehalose 6-phosphate synthase/phosphatase